MAVRAEWDNLGGSPVPRRELVRGAALWTLFCVGAVALRGVRWDEQYEMAQVVLRQVPYPDGHPLFRCTRSALNLQIYFTSALLWLTHSAFAVCAFRNTLYLMSSVIPVYLFGSTLARSCRVGHVAAVLTFMGLPEEFHGSYPLHIWPPYSSTGPIGTGFALLIVYFLMVGAWRSGFLLLGLMPGLHVAQMPAPLALAAFRLAYALRAVERRRVLVGLGWLSAGVGVCGLMWLGRGLVSVPPPVQGPYFAPEAPEPIWRTFVKFWDEHRSLPGGMIQYTRSFFAMGAALFLVGACARMERLRLRSMGAWQWLLAYVALASAAVWGVMAIHEVAGERIPYVLIAWMPYRYSNHVVLLLLAAIPAMFGIRPLEKSDSSAFQYIVVLGALLFGVFRPVLGAILPESLYSRYVATGEGVLFLLCGLASAHLFRVMETDRAFRGPWLAAQLAGVLVLAGFHRFGAAMVGTGITAGFVLSRALAAKPDVESWFSYSPRSGRAISATCVVVLAVLVYPQWQSRQTLPRTNINRAAAVYLAERGEPNAMLVSNPDQYSLQAQTGHPVLIDGPLTLWIPYMPSVGPSIQKVVSEVYGFRYEQPGAASRSPWTEVWRQRRVAEWQALVRAYSIRYVVCPITVRLNLPEVVRESDGVLYEIPREGRANE